MQEPADLVGKVIAKRYRITDFIGAGGMAWVFKAASSERASSVALKVLHPELAQDPIYLRRFRLEAKVASRIVHPGAVQVFEHGVHEQVPFIAMELLDGPTLAELVADEGPMQPRRALLLTCQVCEVVHAAHREGVLHRDLKPENVVVLGQPPDEQVKVLDFGLAKIYAPRPGAENTSSGPTVQGTVVGTPEYMAPEQCGGETLDQRADVYSCGALLYHLLTGKPPFDGNAAYVVMLKHMYEQVVPPSALAPGLLPALEAAVLKALDKKPAARFQSARHMQLALLKLAGEAAGDPAAEPLAAPFEELSMEPDLEAGDVSPESQAAWRVAQRVAALSRTGTEPPQARSPRWLWMVLAAVVLIALGFAATWALVR